MLHIILLFASTFGQTDPAVSRRQECIRCLGWGGGAAGIHGFSVCASAGLISRRLICNANARKPQHIRGTVTNCYETAQYGYMTYAMQMHVTPPIGGGLLRTVTKQPDRAT